MKIAVSCHPTQGGSGIVATELATALVTRGHEVHLAACKRPYRLAADSGVVFHLLQVPDYPLFRFPPHDLSLANKLAGICRNHDIDIIHAHYAIPHAITALLARQTVQPHKVRIVTTLHGTDITLVGSHAEFFDLTRHAMIESDALTAVSTWLRDQTMERFQLPRVPEVIYNFVDTVRFSLRGRAAYPRDGEPFHVLHASNLRPVKRIADIVRVFHEVQKKLPARLTILGEGPEKGLAQELVSELNLCGKVAFTSTADDVPKMMRSAHLNFLLSEYESFGLAALEGMSCGTPVAASSGGGLPEVIDHDRTGLLCPVGDVACTAQQVIALLGSRERWEAMSRETAADVRRRFALESIVPHYEELYERVRGSAT
ncbi:MAG: N-acetyl-alpha-D-glucosaminyl L-malate synthase BshA [Candidatus Eisenbacteria sp.]|nr:N-acetyl-alpha-D-glucosaminyl L-malate synthase BshA [Candidatus Eisenbacteria bacterium]